MAFPTIPTVAGGRVLFTNQADTFGTRTFPDLSSLTKNAGDLLIAIITTYQSTTNPQFSSWGGGFTELPAGGDQGSATTMGIGVAYKISDGTETGTFTVTQAATITGHASMCLMSIPLANSVLVPEAGTISDGTSAAADPGSFNPANWGTEDTLWISVAVSGMTSGTGSWTGTGTTAPANYGDRADSNTTDSSTVGQTEIAVAFRQLNGASEDVGTAGVDTSNARNSALVIAIPPVIAGALAGAGAITLTPTAAIVGDGALAGSAAVTLTPTAAITGAAELTGSASVSFTPTATLDGISAIDGVAAIAFAPAGTLVGAGALAGGAALALDGAGAMAGAGALTGTATLTLDGAATLTGSGALSGAAALSFAPVGALIGSGALAGASSIEFTLSATTDLPEGELTGSAALSIGTTAALVGAGALAGSAAVALTPSGAMVANGDLSGLASLTFTPAGVLLADGALAGSSVLALIATGELDQEEPGAIFGQAAISISASAVLSASYPGARSSPRAQGSERAEQVQGAIRKNPSSKRPANVNTSHRRP